MDKKVAIDRLAKHLGLELKPAFLTDEEICIRCGFTRLEGDAFRVRNPARWARMKDPAYWDKLGRALQREARKIAYGIYLSKARLYPAFLWLKCQRATLDVVCYALSSLHKFFSRVGHK
ncbi:MAG: hypothetical protein M3436_00810 [Pseudomonadota bacterium]|nr:hypothetical protein [Pseudomonadota bacterium]